MPVIIELTFPAGRYHATPWGRHVNEGVPEWPPSPWRFLRAIVAVWKRTCPELSEAQVRRILETLAQPPRFVLPRHRVAHTRHYMPWEKKGPADRTLVFDTFVSIGRRDPLLVGWLDAELSGDDRAILSRLLGNLSSLGRAEGWVRAALSEKQDAEWNVGPAEPSDTNPVPVLCPDPATAFDDEFYPTFDPKKLAKGKVNPSDFLFDCPRWHLCLDTETIANRKWSAIPGTKWVNYTRQVEVSTMSSTRRSPGGHWPTVARLLLDGPVLPLVNDTLRVAEAVRRGLMGRYQRHCHREKYGRSDKPYQESFPSEVLSGKGEDGHFLQQHRHAFYLPSAEGGDERRVTHVTITAADGFGPDEVAALNGLRTVKVDGDSPDLRVQLVGLGDRRDFRTRLLEDSAVWVSATPFLVTRHMKRNGTKRDPREFFEAPDGRDQFVEQVLREELRRRGLFQEGMAIERLAQVGAGAGLRPIQFRLYRSKAGDDGGARLRGLFRLRFPTPVAGPIALGHSCHFGLGLFVTPEAPGSP